MKPNDRDLYILRTHGKALIGLDSEPLRHVGRTLIKIHNYVENNIAEKPVPEKIAVEGSHGKVEKFFNRIFSSSKK